MKNEKTKQKLNELNDEEEKSLLKKHPIIKKITAVIITGALVISACKCANTNDKKVKEVKPKAEVGQEIDEPTYDEERYDYFQDHGVRKSDAITLAQNADKISDILSTNNVEIDDNKIDDLLLSIYNGEHIMSTGKTNKNGDTYMDYLNGISVEVIQNVHGEIDTDLSDNAEALEFAKYLDIQDGSKMDTYLTSLVDVTKEFYNDLNNKDKAQKLGNLIAKIRLKSGYLTPAEQGVIVAFIMNADAVLLDNYSELKVSGEDMTFAELFYQVNTILVIDEDKETVRTLL